MRLVPAPWRTYLGFWGRNVPTVKADRIRDVRRARCRPIPTSTSSTRRGDDFFLWSAITKANNAAFERDALVFQITESIPATGDTKRMGCVGPMPGTLRPSLPWAVKMVGSPEMATR
jgi:hypothetical protein